MASTKKAWIIATAEEGTILGVVVGTATEACEQAEILTEDRGEEVGAYLSDEYPEYFPNANCVMF